MDHLTDGQLINSEHSNRLYPLTVYVADISGQGDFGSLSPASHLGSAGLKVIISLAGSPFGGFGSGCIPLNFFKH